MNSVRFTQSRSIFQCTRTFKFHNFILGEPRGRIWRFDRIDKGSNLKLMHVLQYFSNKLNLKFQIGACFSHLLFFLTHTSAHSPGKRTYGQPDSNVQPTPGYRVGVWGKTKGGRWPYRARSSRWLAQYLVWGIRGGRWPCRARSSRWLAQYLGPSCGG